MGIKLIPTKVFIAYLKSLGLVFIRKDAWNHDLYDYPHGHVNGKLLRPCSVRPKYKDIPSLHIHTNLKAVGKSKSEFEQWLKSYKR